jgi:hypothetical protein
MKHLKSFENKVNEFKPMSLKDRILSFLPAALRKEVPFSEGIDALYGLTNDHMYIIMAIRARLKNLEKQGKLGIDKAAHKELRMQFDELEMVLADVYNEIKKIDQEWSGPSVEGTEEL